MENIRKIAEVLKGLEKNDFTGFIRISFSRGGITQVEKNEEMFRNNSKTMKI